MTDQPQLGFEPFHGQEVVTATLSLAGTIRHVTALPPRELPHGQVVLLVVADVRHVGFDRSDLGLIRVQKAGIGEAYELAEVLDVRQVEMLLARLRMKTQEAVAGRVALTTPNLQPMVDELEMAELEREMIG